MALTFTDGPQPSVVGVRVYYADGAVRQASTLGELTGLPTTGVIVLNLYYGRTYTEYINGHPTQQYYKDTLVGTDWYWVKPNLQAYGTAPTVVDVPPGSIALQGQYVEKALFLSIYNQAYNDRVW